MNALIPVLILFFAFFFSGCGADFWKEAQLRGALGKSYNPPEPKATVDKGPEELISKEISLGEPQKSEKIQEGTKEITEKHVPGKIRILYDKMIESPPQKFPWLKIGVSRKWTVEKLVLEAEKTGRVVISIASLQKLWGQKEPLLTEPLIMTTTYRSDGKLQRKTGYFDRWEVPFLCNIESYDEKTGVIILRPEIIGICGNGAENWRFEITFPRWEIKEVCTPDTVIKTSVQKIETTYKYRQVIEKTIVPVCPSVTYTPEERTKLIEIGGGTGPGGDGGGSCGGGGPAGR